MRHSLCAEPVPVLFSVCYSFKPSFLQLFNHGVGYIKKVIRVMLNPCSVTAVSSLGPRWPTERATPSC